MMVNSLRRDAKSVPSSQMLGGLIEMVTKPYAWMFMPLLIAGIALLIIPIAIEIFTE